MGDEYYAENLQLAESLLRLLKEQGKTASTAESCTGGLLGVFLTEIPGSSEVFQGGVTCYSNESKSKILSVPEALIAKHGAVSEEVVSDLARQANRLFETDLSLATTGIAGPGGGTDLKPAGTVWCALALRGGKTHSWKLSLKGDRHAIRMQTVRSVFQECLKQLRGSV